MRPMISRGGRCALKTSWTQTTLNPPWTLGGYCPKTDPLKPCRLQHFDRAWSRRLHTTQTSLLQSQNKPTTEDAIASTINPGRSFPNKLHSTTTATRKAPLKHGIPAFIALGSNLGDTLSNIESACNLMDADPGIRVEKTSALYETAPMYVEDQGRFLNGACEIRTTYAPLELLDRLQWIERELKREKVVEKGPRTIDLDVLMYGDEIVKEERLSIPHPLMHEREFVLRPLVDIRSAQRRRIPGPQRDESNIVSSQLARISSSSNPMYSQVQLAPGMPALQYGNLAAQTVVMSILNTTPDSFSDGGDNKPVDAEALKRTVQSHIAAGAKIIDIGGQSSRPHAPDVTADEEISRILPAIEAVKSCPDGANVAISVDTYRATVAEAAVQAGAHIINDISAGKLDSDMFSTVARLGCTYVMMHMRGNPSTMQSEENCRYPDGVLRTIVRELRERIDLAEDAGIRRWRMILDPGIGFSKTHAQNLDILAGMSEVSQMLPNYPWLLGSSRKGFVGKVTGVREPKDRVWGTAATVAAAVQGGANIVRVHDVSEMATVAKMADAIYRR